MVIKFHFRRIGDFKSVKKSDWWRVLKYGIQIVTTLFLTSLLTTSTRIYIEHFTDFNSVGTYSLFIRIASAIIIFHRVIVILLYRKIYGDAHSKLDNYFSILIVSAVLGGLLLYFLVPYIAPSFLPSFIQTNERSGNIFLWTILQAVSWTTVAVLELVIYRENILARYIPYLLFILILMAAAFVINQYISPLTSLEILKINVLAVLGIAFCQLYLIKKKSFYYKKTLWAHCALCILSLGCLFL